MKTSFQNLITSHRPVLVDFFATWCGPCKALAPILKQVKDELGDGVSIIKIDVDKNEPLAMQYQVRGVPTVVLFRDGKVVWRESGVMPKEVIVKAIRGA